MNKFEVSLPVFTYEEMERRQQDLLATIELIREAMKQGKTPVYDPHSIHIPATRETVCRQGRQGKLIVPHVPYFHPTALFELRYVETDYRKTAALPFEQVYTFERTNDGDFFAMVSDKVCQHTSEMGLSLAGLHRVMSEANTIQEVEDSAMFDTGYAIALEEIETYASLQPATESDIATLKELLEIAINGDVHEELCIV